MKPQAYIVHSLSGRLRLKVPEKRHDKVWFTQIASRLEQEPGVERVDSNPLSAGLLLHHAPDAPMAQQLRESGLLRIGEPGASKSPVVDTLTDVVTRSDRALERRTRGKANLRSILILILVLLAIIQTLRGRILVPALSLLIFAMQLMLHARDRQ